MFQPWMVWYGDTGITDLFIHDVEKAASEMQFIDAQLGHHETGRQDNAIRRSKVKWLTKDQHFYLVDTAYQFVINANKEAFGVDINDLPSLQYTVYDGKDKGYYDWHADVFWTMQQPYDRKLSVIIQLSDGDGYEGGDIELEGGIPSPDPVQLRKKGTVFVFPSVYYHRVTPVTRGIRKSLVGWVDGPAWR